MVLHSDIGAGATSTKDQWFCDWETRVSGLTRFGFIGDWAGHAGQTRAKTGVIIGQFNRLPESIVWMSLLESLRKGG
jgi:hypothetical protein